MEMVTLTKLIILYMLNLSKTPVKKITVQGFILDRDYTNFFTFTKAFSELIEAEFISEYEENNNNVYLNINKGGEEALNNFNDRISKEFKQEIAEFLSDSNIDSVLVERNFAEYERVRGGYKLKLKRISYDEEILNISLLLPGKEAAKAACDSFMEGGEDIYELLIDRLLP